MLFCAAAPDLYSFFTKAAYPTTFFPFPKEVEEVPDFNNCTDVLHGCRTTAATTQQHLLPPPNSNSIVTTTAGTTVEAEAAAATTVMAVATGNNQPCTKANKVVAVVMCIPPRPTSDGRIGTIAIHMVVMSKMPTQVPHAPDEAPSTTQMPRVPTPWAAHRRGCTRQSYLLQPAVTHLPPANSNNSSNVLLSPTTPCRILCGSHLLGSMGCGSPWQCPLLSKAPP
jgi:hypothetical protein